MRVVGCDTVRYRTVNVRWWTIGETLHVLDSKAGLDSKNF